MTNESLFSGLRVLDIASFIAGPAAATVLSDFGADVIKVKRPGMGDPHRYADLSPPNPSSLENFTWQLANRNKPIEVTNTYRGDAAAHDRNEQTEVLAARDVLPVDRKLMQARQGMIAGYDFDRFRVLLRRRQLLSDGYPVALATRAFDLLLVLLEAVGSSPKASS